MVVRVEYELQITSTEIGVSIDMELSQLVKNPNRILIRMDVIWRRVELTVTGVCLDLILLLIKNP